MIRIAVFCVIFIPTTFAYLHPNLITKLHNPSGSFQKLSVVSSTEAVGTKDELYEELLQEVEKIGQVGSKSSEEKRNSIASVADRIVTYSDETPARVELTGTHNLVYSAAPGGSSGAIGPFVGKVSQLFIDDTIFKNVVQLGPLEVELTAERKILDDTRIRVKFIETRVKLFSVEVLKKETAGEGVWKILHAGVIQGKDGNRRLLRIMKTPSLFIIEQNL